MASFCYAACPWRDPHNKSLLINIGNAIVFDVVIANNLLELAKVGLNGVGLAGISTLAIDAAHKF